MKCFYHVDNDGKCAGAIVAMKEYMLSKTHEYPDSSCFYKINYGFPFPFDEIEPYERIYIVDYSLDPKDMEKLLDITSNIIWIDHHITSINKYKNTGFKIPGIRMNGIAGCVLTYIYLFMMCDNTEYSLYHPKTVYNTNMLRIIPKFIDYVGDYDVWTFKYGDETKFFKLGLEAIDKNEPYDDIWKQLFNHETNAMENILKSGSTISQYKSKFAKEYCQSKGFKTTFEGYRAYCMNIGLAGSDWFDSVDSSEYDILLLFSTGNGRTWSYSIYSETVDVSEIAKKYGGGGHKKASGFQSKKLLLKKPREKNESIFAKMKKYIKGGL
jgi:oligoribonuclease NrnB/cAMP/cGMP phosphodiesterase (DHH superfamily)